MMTAYFTPPPHPPPHTHTPSPPISQFQRMSPGPFSHFTHLPFALTEAYSFPINQETLQCGALSQRQCQMGGCVAGPWWVQQAFGTFTIKTSTVWPRGSPGTAGWALGVVLIPVRRKRPVESSAQDSASDSCSETQCVRQHNCPPCYPACSPSCPIGYLYLISPPVHSPPTYSPRWRDIIIH